MPDNLPKKLRQLYCDNNKLRRLPVLPDSINTLMIGYNLELSHLPALPTKLKVFIAVKINITILPILPRGVQLVYITSPHITKLYKNRYSHNYYSPYLLMIGSSKFERLNNNITFARIMFYVNWLLYPLQTRKLINAIDDINARTMHIQKTHLLHSDLQEGHLRIVLKPTRIARLIDENILNFESADTWELL